MDYDSALFQKMQNAYLLTDSLRICVCIDKNKHTCSYKTMLKFTTNGNIITAVYVLLIAQSIISTCQFQFIEKLILTSLQGL